MAPFFLILYIFQIFKIKMADRCNGFQDSHIYCNRWRVSGHLLLFLKSQFLIGKRLVGGVPGRVSPQHPRIEIAIPLCDRCGQSPAGGSHMNGTARILCAGQQI